MIKELQALFEQDQADRSAFEYLDHGQRQQVFQRDRARRKRVEELLGSEMVARLKILLKCLQRQLLTFASTPLSLLFMKHAKAGGLTST